MHQWLKKWQQNCAQEYVTMLYKCMVDMVTYENMEYKNMLEMLEFIKYYKEQMRL